jgi:hypothetical protein
MMVRAINYINETSSEEQFDAKGNYIASDLDEDSFDELL